MEENLRKKIHKSNIELHRIEAEYYETLHSEIYNKIEQNRIKSTLERIDKLIENNQKKALDFGAGTGNITEKLLKMGYIVTSTDISLDMCIILRRKYNKYMKEKKLTVINSKIEDVFFNKEEFDLIACYSVLHHLPDYINVIKKLSFYLKKGGIMYLDHEESPFYWVKSKKDKILTHIDYIFIKLLNILIFRIRNIKLPSINYSLDDYYFADYWDKKDHHLNHKKIERVFKEENFVNYIRKDYHLYKQRFFNPIFYIIKYISKPDMSLWIAKK